MFKKILVLLALLGMTSPAYANDQELYDPAPPADSAFVRLINATGDAEKITASVGSITFKELGSPAISPYYVLKGGEYSMKLGEASFPVKVDAGKYYTLALQREAGKPTLTVLPDAMISDPAKSIVYFYNLSNVPSASLVAAEHKIDIVAATEPGKGGAREVKPLTLALAIKSGDKEIKTFSGVELKRRTGFTFLLAGTESDPVTLMQENKIER